MQRNVLVWAYPRSLLISAFWGSPSVEEITEIIRVYDGALARSTEPFRALIDFSRLEHVDPSAFAIMAEWTRRSRAWVEPRLAWQAIVTPPGVLGAIVCGFHRSLGYSIESRFFSSLEDAVATMFDPGEAKEVREEVLPRLATAARATWLTKLCAFLRQHPRATVEQAARGLSLSKRTLQRYIAEAETTFLDTRMDVRIALAKQHLGDRERKVETLADELGFRSRQHFARQFQKLVGVSPSAYRDKPDDR